MASTLAGDRLTEEYRKTNISIQAITMKGFDAINRAFLLPAIDTGNRSPWLSRILSFSEAVSNSATTYTQAYLKAYRLAEGIPGKAPQMPQRGFNKNRMAGMAMATAFNALREELRKGNYQTVYDIPSPTVKRSMTRCRDWAVREVLASSRSTVVSYARSDDRAVGYARVTDGSPCKFCAALAMRGPVYNQKSSNFPSHSKCACGGEPVYDSWSYPPEVEALAQTYMDEYRVKRNDDIIKKLENKPVLNSREKDDLAFYKDHNAKIKAGEAGGYLYDDGKGGELAYNSTKKSFGYPENKEDYIASLDAEKKRLEGRSDIPYPVADGEEQKLMNQYWNHRSNGEKPAGRDIEIPKLGIVGAYERVKGLYVDETGSFQNYDLTAGQMEYTANKRQDWKFS